MTSARQRSLPPAGTGGIDRRAGPGAVISVWTMVSSAARTHKQQHISFRCLLAFHCTCTLCLHGTRWSEAGVQAQPTSPPAGRPTLACRPWQGRRGLLGLTK